MKLKFLLLVIAIIQVFFAYSQSPWIDSEYRNKYYPQDSYYVSYHYLINEGNLNECINKAILGAQSMLANSISSEVTTSSKSIFSSVNENGVLNETDTFHNQFSVNASAFLVNAVTEHFYDSSSNMVHAIAYVKKQDLSDFCESKLEESFVLIDNHIATIERYVTGGYKSEAKKLVAESFEHLEKYPLYFSELIAIGKTKNDPTTYVSRYEHSLNSLLKYRSDLEHCISVCMNANFKSPFVKNELLSEKCKGYLSKNGFSFADNVNEADYVIVLDYQTRTSSKTDIGYFAYADINITITRKRDNCKIYEDALSVKGGSSTEDKAHRKAIEQSSKQISEIIVNKIN